MSIEISHATSKDLEEICDLNNSSLPHVTPVDREKLEKFLAISSCFRVARMENSLAGFLIALDQDAQYDNDYFRWFSSRYPQFVYIDRVVVAPGFRRHGVGRVLYADVQSFAEKRAPVLGCEVNIDPPNQVSLTFHGTSGFVEAGQLKSDKSRHVSLLTKALPAYEFIVGKYGSSLI